MKSSVKIIAHYFPQFHRIPENDLWWGSGFTDWNNVKVAKPLFSDHYQPRVPLNNKYYDLSERNTIKWQAKLAKKYGIYGFCFYHYWFDGKLLLERPLEVYLENNDIDFPFCISWANETWSKRWIGKDKEVLISQKHTPNKQIWREHFNYLKRFWQDDRYIKINGRPIFLIYQPEIINDFPGMVQYWNKLCDENNIPRVYFIATKSHEFKDNINTNNHYDAIANFQPRQIYNSPNFSSKSFFAKSIFQKLRFLPENLLNIITSIRYKLSSYEVIDYNEIWREIIDQELNINNGEIITYPGAFVGWDNTPRYGNKAKIYDGATPKSFEYWMKELISIIEKREEKIIFLNAWNEWAEGAYLEPDEKYGFEYLEAIKSALRL